jgi:prepilin-type N-terminal cleavage/methylation domain-containing protein
MNKSARLTLSPAAARGFTLFELIVVVCIVAILAGTLLSRLWFYQEQAEKAAMEQVAAVLQSALTMRLGSMMVSGSLSDAEKLAKENPMDWLVRKPNNYAGEFFDPAPQTVVPGNWMFDLKSRNLIYVVDRGAFFTPGRDGVKWVRYHVNLIFDREGGKGEQTLAGAAFEPVESYRWFDRRL